MGLPRDTVLFTTVVAGLVLLQVSITIAQPLIDRLIYRQDREEIAWLRYLDNRLLRNRIRKARGIKVAIANRMARGRS